MERADTQIAQETIHPGRVLARRAAAWIQRARPTIIVGALLLALPLVLLAPQTIGGRSLVPYDALVSDPLYRPALQAAGIERPQNQLVADLVYQNVVWKDFLVTAWRDGELPLWNPDILGGMPFLAAGQHGGLFPTSPLFVWLGVDRAFGWAALLLLWWAAISAYVFARTIGLRRGAGLVAGIAWSMSSLSVSNVVFPMIQGVLATAPLVLAGIARLTEPRPAIRAGARPPGEHGALWWIITATATALVGLSGHVEMLIYTASVAFVFAVWRLSNLMSEDGRATMFWHAAWIGGAALSGALVASVQLIPLYELAATSHRSGAPYAAALEHAFGLRQIITFLIPDFYGNPAHHAVLSIDRWHRVPLDGHAMWGTAWGAKNYVEAAAYVGVPTLLLAGVGLGDRRRRRLAVFLAVLALLSLALAFGTPLYRLLFVMPGIDQLRTPFRWVYPYVLSLVMLAAIGLDALLAEQSLATRSARRVARSIGAAALGGGLWLGFVLGLALAFPRRWADVVDVAISSLPDARGAVIAAFGQMPTFASYQLWNLLHVSVFVTLSGVALLIMAKQGATHTDRRRGAMLAAAALAADLMLIGYGFNPAIDRSLADVEPRAVDFLRDATEIKWGRVVGFGDSKVLWPNSAMRAGIPDIRGYDSIIPWWTADTLGAIEDQSGWLQFNRIGNLIEPSSLEHPALLALGGRYIVTREEINDPELSLLYDDEVRVYENTRALPRAWLVNEVRVVTDRNALRGDLATFDPRREVLLEEEPDLAVWEAVETGRQVYQGPIEFKRSTNREMELDFFAGQPSMLVLSEAYFPGWRAWVEPAGATGQRKVEVPVYRADGMLRAVPVPAGRMRVTLSYFPMSIKLGLYGAFLGLIILFLMAVYGAWARFVRIDEEDAIQRIAVNSAGPIGAALVSKVLLFVFAMLYLRILGPEDAGRYYLAVTVYTLADIVVNFGLNLLVAREVARRPDEAPSLLAASIALRLGLWLAVLPLLAGYIALQAAIGDPLDRSTIITIALLAAALVPANLNTALSSIYQGLERMVLPAAINVVSTVVTVSLGALALMIGWGFVGLAAMAIVTNWLTFALLLGWMLRDGLWPFARVRPALVRWMALSSLPLMLNHLLQIVFFKIDILLLKPMAGELVVGWYQTAYKWVEAMLILPAYLTMALFPMLSRRGADDRDGLRHAWVNTMRWLLAVALPIAVMTTYLAESLIRLLGGEEYLPQGAQALQIMIWFLPLSYVNGVTQYVLIAVDRQRWITVSFAVAATFNIVVNLMVIPKWGFAGAAAVTVASEAILMAPFFWGLRDLGAPSPLILAWRPLLAASAMAIFLGVADGANVAQPLGATGAAAIYLVSLRLLGWLTDEDRKVLARLRPRFVDR